MVCLAGCANREVRSLPCSRDCFYGWRHFCFPDKGGYVLGFETVRFHIAPDSLEAAVIEAAQEGHGLILAMSSVYLFGVEGMPVGKVAGLWNVEFTEEQVWEMLENRAVGVKP